MEENELGDKYVNIGELLVKAQAMEQWTALERMPLHGVYARELKKGTTDKTRSHRWLVEGVLQAKTEGFVVAAQDGVLKTNVYKRKIMKLDVPEKCRICAREETCPERWSLYTHRHDKVLYQLTKSVLPFLK